jgi:putative hemolysin
LKKYVISVRELEEMSPLFKGKWGNLFAKLVIRIFAMDKVNDVYAKSCRYQGAEFAEHLLKDLGVKCQIGYPERLQQLPEGAFITVSNHPYGGLDGIMLIDLMAEVRPDYKLMVNKMLSLVEAMDVNFIAVKPKVGHKEADGINGIRETLTRLDQGHPVGFFPAGAVSMFRLKDFRIRDRKCQRSMLKLIRVANVPVVPIRFYGHNSAFFYFLGMINWRIRLIRMPYELFNKGNRPHRIGIGQILIPEELAKCPDYDSLGLLLQKAVYNMPKPDSFVPKEELAFLRKKGKY